MISKDKTFSYKGFNFRFLYKQWVSVPLGGFYNKKELRDYIDNLEAREKQRRGEM